MYRIKNMDNIGELIKQIDETKIIIGDIILTNTQTKKQLIIKANKQEELIIKKTTLLDLPNDVLNIIGEYVKKYRYQDKLKYYEDKYYLNDNYYAQTFEYIYKLDKKKFKFIDEEDEDNQVKKEANNIDYTYYEFNDDTSKDMYYHSKQFNTTINFILKKGDNNKEFINNVEKENIERINEKLCYDLNIIKLVQKKEGKPLNIKNRYKYKYLYIENFGETDEEFNNLKNEYDITFKEIDDSHGERYTYKQIEEIDLQYNLKFRELFKKRIIKETSS